MITNEMKGKERMKNVNEIKEEKERNVTGKHDYKLRKNKGKNKKI